ncbi:family 20 glycosylhydrolase [Lactococcus petauri]|uniref:family 20 glycosylhydrolase n=1 Tax=Lactococcus petauri TaxID=1940789 RepID=UPI0022E14BBE|nr:family 20 glycosylhydrolase [Lactococcus petauri]
MNEVSVQAYIQFRNANWEWVGTPISLGEVSESTVIGIANHVPNGYLLVKDIFNPTYTIVSEDIQWALENPQDSADYGLPEGGLVLNAELELSSILTGLNIDMGRHYYSVEVIKLFIDTLALVKHPYLQLHMTDNENVGMESELLGQTVEGAVFENNMYINPNTGMPFLSKDNLREIVAYAQSKNVLVIPEVNIPGHMTAILNLVKELSIDLYNSIKQDDANMYVSKTMDYSKEASIIFAQQLLGEYFDIFSKQENACFSIGADEVGVIAPNTDIHPITNPAFVNFCNQMNQFIKQNGFKMRMYNDYIASQDVESFDKDIQVMYWSLSGGLDLDDSDAYTQSGTANNARAQQLMDASFELLNYNGYYLYMIAGDRAFQPDAMAYTIQDMKNNFKLVHFYLNSGLFTSLSPSIIGGAISIWGGEAGNYTDLEIQEHTKDFVEAFVELLNP